MTANLDDFPRFWYVLAWFARALPQVYCRVLLYYRKEEIPKFLEKQAGAIKFGGVQCSPVPAGEVFWQSDPIFLTDRPEYNRRSINISPLPSKLPLPLILHIKTLHSESKVKKFGAQNLLMPLKFRPRWAGHIN